MATSEAVKGTVLPAEEQAGKFRAFLTSSVLILFTIVVGLLCVLVLSCTLTQTRMASIAIEGVNVSVWKLDDVRKQWSALRQQINHQAETLSGTEADLASETRNIGESESKFRSARTDLDSLLETFNFRVRPFDEELAKAMSGKSPAEQIGRLNAAQATIDAHPELKPLVDQIAKEYTIYSPIYEERMRGQATLQAKKDQTAALRVSVKSLHDSLDQLFDQFSAKPVDAATRARLENALFELYSGGPILGKFINKLITFPSDILTLFLVILMGVLGSSLQMTHALFKFNRIERVGAYLLRLSVGAITALVIFIVAKAGVPVIADASRLGGDAPINPYFVSFLAIVSGLMSENAILSVQAQGARLFAPDGPPDKLRWARSDLHEVFKSANRVPGNVRQLLETVDENQFEEWITGKKPLPGNAQTLIAGALGKSRRELFTDLPPDEGRDVGAG